MKPFFSHYRQCVLRSKCAKLPLPRVAARAGIASLFAAWVLAIAAASASAQAPLSVWFGPDGGSPDLAKLFTTPDQWVKARSLVSVFGFGPGQLQAAAAGQPYLLNGISSVEMFRIMKKWGLNTVIGVPSLKEWDCEARQTSAMTVGWAKVIYAAGGTVRFVDMDEPLVSALGLNTPVCKLDIDTAAAEVAAYAHAVTSDPAIIGSGTVPRIVDTEAYPSLSVGQLESWISALERNGFRPDALHLDVNVGYLDVNPTARARLAGDLKELQSFLHRNSIIFGIIIWSGADPLPTDESYYDHAMTWVRRVHAAIGRPDRVAFESWVTRCSLTLPCVGPNLQCAASDPSYCGSNSVPLNLPEKGQAVYSHTKLILDATAVMNGR